MLFRTPPLSTPRHSARAVVRAVATSLTLLLVTSIASPVAQAAQTEVAAPAEHAFRLTGGWSTEGASWVSVDGERIAFGEGSLVQLAVGLETPALLRAIEAGMVVADAALVEDTLYVNDGSRIALLDLDEAAPSLRRVHLSPEPRAALKMTRMTDYLVVSEDGFGLRIVALPPPEGMLHKMSDMKTMDHSMHVMHATQIATHPLRATFSAITAAGNVIFAVTGPGVITAIDFNDPQHPVSRTVAVEPGVRALAANGDRLYVLSDAGLTLIDTAAEGAPVISEHPEMRGAALQIAGRSVHIVDGGTGLRTFADTSAIAALIDVTVGNNFFSPRDITVDAGDTVRWTKAGGFHNVEGCSPGAGESRCGGLTSTEVFRSGAATFDPFVFQHIFTETGTHSYVCVIHAFNGGGMVGSVTVDGGPSCGDGAVDPFSEECDDGNVISGDGCEADCTFTRAGSLPTTLLLDKVPGGASGEIALNWDASCLVSDNFVGVYAGTMPDFATYKSLSCENTGTSTSFVPNASDSFYLAVPHNPTSEGSYGLDSTGAERPVGGETCQVQRLGTCP